MAIHLNEEDRKIGEIKKPVVRKWLEEVIRNEGHIAGVVNIIFCSDEYLLNINSEFLKKDYLTDVISFSYPEKGRIGGDIFISKDRIEENAKDLGVTFLEEVSRVMVHGVLHLVGYEDDNPINKDKMTRREDFYLAKLQERDKY